MHALMWIEINYKRIVIDIGPVRVRCYRMYTNQIASLLRQ